MPLVSGTLARGPMFHRCAYNPQRPTDLPKTVPLPKGVQLYIGSRHHCYGTNLATSHLSPNQQNQHTKTQTTKGLTLEGDAYLAEPLEV